MATGVEASVAGSDDWRGGGAFRKTTVAVLGGVVREAATYCGDCRVPNLEASEGASIAHLPTPAAERTSVRNRAVEVAGARSHRGEESRIRETRTAATRTTNIRWLKPATTCGVFFF